MLKKKTYTNWKKKLNKLIKLSPNQSTKSFLESCREQLIERHFLSQKQQDIINSIFLKVYLIPKYKEKKQKTLEEKRISNKKVITKRNSKVIKVRQWKIEN